MDHRPQEKPKSVARYFYLSGPILYPVLVTKIEQSGGARLARIIRSVYAPGTATLWESVKADECLVAEISSAEAFLYLRILPLITQLQTTYPEVLGCMIRTDKLFVILGDSATPDQRKRIRNQIAPLYPAGNIYFVQASLPEARWRRNPNIVGGVQFAILEGEMKNGWTLYEFDARTNKENILREFPQLK